MPPWCATPSIGPGTNKRIGESWEFKNQIARGRGVLMIMPSDLSIIEGLLGNVRLVSIKVYAFEFSPQ